MPPSRPSGSIIWYRAAFEHVLLSVRVTCAAPIYGYLIRWQREQRFMSLRVLNTWTSSIASDGCLRGWFAPMHLSERGRRLPRPEPSSAIDSPTFPVRVCRAVEGVGLYFNNNQTLVLKSEHNSKRL